MPERKAPPPGQGQFKFMQEAWNCGRLPVDRALSGPLPVAKFMEVVSAAFVAGPSNRVTRQPDAVTDGPRALLFAAGVNSHYI